MTINTAVGIIETYGLTAAIEAADAALKAANVRLLGSDFSQGNGWVAIKVAGDVGAVQAAIAAATASAEKLSQVIATLIKPRPHGDLSLFLTPAPPTPEDPTQPPCGGCADSGEPAPQAESAQPEQPVPVETTREETVLAEEIPGETMREKVPEETVQEEPPEAAPPEETVLEAAPEEAPEKNEEQSGPLETAGDIAATEPEEFVPEEKKELVMAAVSRVFTCNLCKDPACPRKKGQPRQWCIHRNEAEEG